MSINIHTNNSVNSDNPSTPFFCNNNYTPNKYNFVFNSGEEYTLKSHQKPIPSLSKISPLNLAKSNNLKCSPFQLNQEDSCSTSKRNSTKDIMISANSRNEENKLLHLGSGNASTTQDYLSSQRDEDDKGSTIKKERKVLFENIQEQAYEYNQEQEEEESSDNNEMNRNSNEISMNENNVYKKENKEMVIQMVKALCYGNKYDHDKYTIAKCFKLDNSYFYIEENEITNSNIDDIPTSYSNRTANFNYPLTTTNRRVLDTQAVTFRDKMFSSIMKNNTNHFNNNNLIPNIFPVDYTFDVNETKDKDIHLMCFLTIPRIICRNDLLQLMVISPLINLKQSSFISHKREGYFILFKQIQSMKLIDKIDIQSITLCYINSYNSFCIQFINQQSFQKEIYVIYTKNKEECTSYVEGINYFKKSNY